MSLVFTMLYFKQQGCHEMSGLMDLLAFLPACLATATCHGKEGFFCKILIGCWWSDCDYLGHFRYEEDYHRLLFEEIDRRP